MLRIRALRRLKSLKTLPKVDEITAHGFNAYACPPCSTIEQGSVPEKRQQSLRDMLDRLGAKYNREECRVSHSTAGLNRVEVDYLRVTDFQVRGDTIDFKVGSLNRAPWFPLGVLLTTPWGQDMLEEFFGVHREALIGMLTDAKCHPLFETLEPYGLTVSYSQISNDLELLWPELACYCVVPIVNLKKTLAGLGIYTMVTVGQCRGTLGDCWMLPARSPLLNFSETEHWRGMLFQNTDGSHHRSVPSGTEQQGSDNIKESGWYPDEEINGDGLGTLLSHIIVWNRRVVH